jgi:hypothetical protein
MLAGNYIRYQPVLVLLPPDRVQQSRILRDRAIVASTLLGRIHPGYLQGMLEGIPEEVDPR